MFSVLGLIKHGSLVLLFLTLLNGCMYKKYITAQGDECTDVYIIAFNYVDCTKGERPIELKTDEKKDITIREDKK